MLVSCLKQVKDFILKFSRSGRFFSEKELLNLYTMKLIGFCSGRFVDEDGGNRTNYQRYKYVSVLQYHTLTLIHFMNGEGVC